MRSLDKQPMHQTGIMKNNLFGHASFQMQSIVIIYGQDNYGKWRTGEDEHVSIIKGRRNISVIL